MYEERVRTLEEAAKILTERGILRDVEVLSKVTTLPPVLSGRTPSDRRVSVVGDRRVTYSADEFAKVVERYAHNEHHEEIP